jgi:hypothetical protein
VLCKEQRTPSGKIEFELEKLQKTILNQKEQHKARRVMFEELIQKSLP